LLLDIPIGVGRGTRYLDGIAVGDGRSGEYDAPMLTADNKRGMRETAYFALMPRGRTRRDGKLGNV
jgi:hypothetical protein